MKSFGWLLDLYPDSHRGVILWMITQAGRRLRLHQDLTIDFSMAGSNEQLRQAWKWLKRQPIPVALSRTQGHDLFRPDPVALLTVQVDAANQSRLFYHLERAFSDLEFYNADIQLTLRHAAAFGTFPLCRCEFCYHSDGELASLQVLDSRWDIDPEPAPLRTLRLEPDISPDHAVPSSIIAYDDTGFNTELLLRDPVSLLNGLNQLLKEKDPDILLTTYGDTWLLPLLINLGAEQHISLALNRDPDRRVIQKPERSYFSYGQIIYNGQQIHLAGRIHFDMKNSFILKDTGLDGVLEMARVTCLPLQTAARTSPGTGISSMEVITALANKILVPRDKQQSEDVITASQLIRYDQGGLILEPIKGLHKAVAEIDFVSMYPSVMVLCNISPEKGRPDHLGAEDDPGLVPITLKPLLAKRVAMKIAIEEMDHSDPRCRRYVGSSAVLKWLLVCCFGYLGYKNARFGKIESHESVTAWGREAVLTAKEVAEEMGYSVIHIYVDALWIVKDEGTCTREDLTQVLDAISARTGLSITLDGIYRWLAFLPSKTNAKEGVPNRYFGVFSDDSFKYRGIEARRRDTPQFISETQLQMIKLLSTARTPIQMEYALKQARNLVDQQISDLRSGRVSLEKLVIGQKLSRELENYRSPSQAAKALVQLRGIGKDKRPGQRVNFIYTRTEPGVFAWDLPEKPVFEIVDVKRYERILNRAVETILQPFTDETGKIKQIE
jgi:DNA polymerase-2